MARGAHGWPSTHICRAAGEANMTRSNVRTEGHITRKMSADIHKREVIIVLIIDPSLFFGVSVAWGHLHNLPFSPTEPRSHSSVYTGARGNTWSMTCSCFSVRMLLWTSDVDIHKTSGWWLVVVLIRFFLLLRFESRVAKWQKGLVLLWGLQRLRCCY